MVLSKKILSKKTTTSTRGRVGFLLCLCWVLSVAQEQAQAYPAVNYTTLSNLTTQAAEDILKTVAIGANHRAYQSASPLGLLIGIDAGIDVTAISVPQAFRDALTLVGNTAKIPALIPLPRINLRKGLPLGLDVGASFIGYKDVKVFGGDLQWAFVNDKGPFSVATRAGYNYAKLWYMKTTMGSLDLLGSFKFPLLLDPYAGVGWEFGSGDLDVPAGLLPVGVSSHKSFSNARFFVGLPVSLTLVHLTAEYGYSFAGIHTYGLKASLSF